MADELTFYDHLEELRRRLFWVLAFLVVATVVAFLFIGEIMAILRQPLAGIKIQLAALKPTEKFMVYFKTGLFTGIVAAVPFALWQLGRFVAPALAPREHRRLFGALGLVFLSFLAGCLLSWAFLAPLCFDFFLNFAKDDGVASLWSMGEYYGLLLSLILAVGLIFQVPWVLLLLMRFGIITPADLSRYRRHAVIVIFIVAAVVTPPDVYSQAVVGITLWVLFELTIVAGRLILSQRRAP